MAYCPNCGTEAQSRFCEVCGAPMAFTPVTAPPIPPQHSALSRKRRRWPWFVLIGLVIWFGAAYYFYLDNERTFSEARNRGVDILSTNEKTGVVTARDKLTGKIITMDFNDIGRDSVREETISMPSWIPSYPNVAGSESTKDGSFSFSTADSVDEATGFYESELRKAEMTVRRQISSAGDSPAGVTLIARDAVRNRSITIVVNRKDSGSSITIAIGGK
jgi:hypothetical protein